MFRLIALSGVHGSAVDAAVDAVVFPCGSIGGNGAARCGADLLDWAPCYFPAEHRGWTAPRLSPRFSSVRARIVLTLVSLLAISALASLTTGALLSDRVTMATVTTQGGTLDITVNGDSDDTAVAYGGSGATITTDVSNMAPGDTAWGELTIDNTGTLPLAMTVSSTGSDTHPNQGTGHCFSFYFREVAATGVTGNGASLASPLNLTGMGTAESPDSSTALFETAVSGRQLSDVAASSDVEWETDDTKTYRLTVRMRTECTQGGEGTAAATGTLNFTFNANQV